MNELKTFENKEGMPKRLVQVEWEWDGPGSAILEVPRELDLKKEKETYEARERGEGQVLMFVDWLLQRGAKKVEVEKVRDNG